MLLGVQNMSNMLHTSNEFLRNSAWQWWIHVWIGSQAIYQSDTPALRIQCSQRIPAATACIWCPIIAAAMSAYWKLSPPPCIPGCTLEMEKHWCFFITSQHPNWHPIRGKSPNTTGVADSRALFRMVSPWELSEHGGWTTSRTIGRHPFAGRTSYMAFWAMKVQGSGETMRNQCWRWFMAWVFLDGFMDINHGHVRYLSFWFFHLQLFRECDPLVVYQVPIANL